MALGEKDITQKNFEAYNDVFADIINGCLFDGEEVISETSLMDAQPYSKYKGLSTLSTYRCGKSIGY